MMDPDFVSDRLVKIQKIIMDHELAKKDRLSNLPSNVLNTILGCLPLKDAGRTSILSRGWRYEWSHISTVTFDKNDFPLLKKETHNGYDRRIVRIVDQVLLLHQGPIHKFQLSTYLESCTDIDRWILFISRNGIQELILEKWTGKIYKVPSCLFSCKGMTLLDLYRCSLILPKSFTGLCNLTTLYLEECNFSNDGIENLISICPILESLRLVNIGGFTHLKLRAPKLKTFEVTGAVEYLCFEETPVLAQAYITVDKIYRSSNGPVCQIVNVMSCAPCIKTLELLDSTFQILSKDDTPVMFPVMLRLKRLSLSINFENKQEILTALYIFRSSPVLQELQIQVISKKAKTSVKDILEANEGFSELFGELQSVELNECTGNPSEMRFLEVLLASAPVLQRMQIKFQENTADVLKIIRRLIQFRRISPKAEILVPE